MWHLVPRIAMRTMMMLLRVGRIPVLSVPGWQLKAEVVLHPISCTRHGHGVAFLRGDGVVLTLGLVGSGGGLGGVGLVGSGGGLGGRVLSYTDEGLVEDENSRASQAPVVPVGVGLQVGAASEGLRCLGDRILHQRENICGGHGVLGGGVILGGEGFLVDDLFLEVTRTDSVQKVCGGI